MESSTLAGGPRIMIVNGTRSVIWVAVYKRSPLRGNQPPIAWQVISPPPRGATALFIPRGVEVCARYSFEPENPRRPVYQTRSLPLRNTPAGAGFVIESVSSPDRRTWGAVLSRAAENPGWGQIRVLNRFSIGVTIHVSMDERDIFPPPIVPPTAGWIEDLDSPFHVAVLFVRRVAGDLLPLSEIALTETSVRAGEALRVLGGPRKGFEICRIPEGEAILRTEREDPVEPEVETHAQPPRAPERKPKPEPKAQARPKAEIRKQEPAKKPASRPRGPGKTKKARSNPVLPASDQAPAGG